MTHPAACFAGKVVFKGGVKTIDPDWFKAPGVSDSDLLQRTSDSCKGTCTILLTRPYFTTRVSSGMLACLGRAAACNACRWTALQTAGCELATGRLHTALLQVWKLNPQVGVFATRNGLLRNVGDGRGVTLPPGKYTQVLRFGNMEQYDNFAIQVQVRGWSPAAAHTLAHLPPGCVSVTACRGKPEQGLPENSTCGQWGH